MSVAKIIALRFARMSAGRLEWHILPEKGMDSAIAVTMIIMIGMELPVAVIVVEKMLASIKCVCGHG